MKRQHNTRCYRGSTTSAEHRGFFLSSAPLKSKQHQIDLGAIRAPMTNLHSVTFPSDDFWKEVIGTKDDGWSRNLSTVLKAPKSPFALKAPRHRRRGSRRLRHTIDSWALVCSTRQLERWLWTTPLDSPTFLLEARSHRCLSVDTWHRWITSLGYSLEAVGRFGHAVPVVESYNRILY